MKHGFLILSTALSSTLDNNEPQYQLFIPDNQPRKSTINSAKTESQDITKGDMTYPTDFVLLNANCNDRFFTDSNTGKDIFPEITHINIEKRVLFYLFQKTFIFIIEHLVLIERVMTQFNKLQQTNKYLNYQKLAEQVFGFLKANRECCVKICLDNVALDNATDASAAVLLNYLLLVEDSLEHLENKDLKSLASLVYKSNSRLEHHSSKSFTTLVDNYVLDIIKTSLSIGISYDDLDVFLCLFSLIHDLLSHFYIRYEIDRFFLNQYLAGCYNYEVSSALSLQKGYTFFCTFSLVFYLTLNVFDTNNVIKAPQNTTLLNGISKYRNIIPHIIVLLDCMSDPRRQTQHYSLMFSTPKKIRENVEKAINEKKYFLQNVFFYTLETKLVSGKITFGKEKNDIYKKITDFLIRSTVGEISVFLPAAFKYIKYNS